MASRPLQAFTLLLAATVSGLLFASGDEGGRALPAANNAKWNTECASCHTLYHPALLPERSWRKLMAGLDRHFGENASLDAATQKEIVEFLASHAADRDNSRRARKIAQSVPAAKTPLRISETGYFTHKHDEIRAAVWKRQAIASKANCAACHSGAEQGNFDEHGVRIPR